jgi:hypothetical protein
MLLSLLGFPTMRRAALALYGLGRGDPNYPGSSHTEMGEVFARAAGVGRWRWEYYRRFDFAAVARSLRAQMRGGGRPTLLSFGAVHRNGRWRCRHVAVVVGATDKLIELLDPLGAVPCEGARANVWLLAAEHPAKIGVLGNSYSVSRGRVATVLRWAAGPAR